jgi:hypothetical protein
MKSAPLLLIISLSVVTLNGCSTPPPPSMSPLQLQEMQTHRVDADMKTTFNAVMNVLQDKNYQIVNADVNSGFIKAQSRVNNAVTLTTIDNIALSIPVLPKIFPGLVADYNQMSIITTIQDVDSKKSTLRISMLNHERWVGSDNSSTEKDKTIEDAKAYQSMFEAIDQQLFQQKMMK